MKEWALSCEEGVACFVTYTKIIIQENDYYKGCNHNVASQKQGGVSK